MGNSDDPCDDPVLRALSSISAKLGLPSASSCRDVIAAVSSLVDRVSGQDSALRKRIAKAFEIQSDTEWPALEATAAMLIRNSKASQGELDQSNADFDALTGRYQRLAEEHELAKRNLRRALDSVTNLSQICVSDHNA